MKFTITLILLFISSVIFAQKSNLFVIVTDENGKPLDAVNAALLSQPGNKAIKFSISGKDGKILFENIAPGNYLVKFSAAGLQEKNSQEVEVKDTSVVVNMGSIQLSKKTTDLAAVTVTTKKPFLQRLSDRMIVNVDNSLVSAGSSAFEVLERSPGVTIDNNDLISLKGKQGVIIMIDGKPSPMNGADLANYLKGLPANSIDRIELITNPSSKYDAAGSAGIIDIKMKKDQRLGTNGNFNAGVGQGYYARANTGLGLNYRNKKINAFGTYNYAYRKLMNRLYLDRNFYNNGTFSGADLKDNNSRAPFNNHTVRAGIDFFPNKKTILGIVVSSNFNNFKRDNDNSSIVIDEFHQPSYTFKTNASNDDHANNMIANFNVKHSFNDKGKEITADADYGIYNSRSASNTSTQYYKLSGGSQQPDYVLLGKQKGKLTLATAKADYTNPLKNKASFEAGFKTSFVTADNDAKFSDASNGTPQNDPQKTNHFKYDENNNAAYFNYKKEFQKINFQLGLRAEQTNVKTYQEIGAVSWDSSYLQLFPSAFLNYKLKENQTLGISVSRRINRPGYGQLNPFLFLIDVTTYATGNPGLLPQFTWAYELNYSIKNINIALSYSHTDKNQNVVVARYNDLFPNGGSNDNVTVQIPVNLSSSDYAGISISAPVKINKWWSMINNADIYYNKFNGSLGSTKLNNGKAAADIRINNSFSLNKGWSAELNGNYSTGGQYGFMVTDPQWGVNAAVQKSILNKKGSIRFNITDIFWTNLPKAIITYDNYVEKWHAKRDTRIANLSFTYRFGKNTVQAARKRTTASEEERQRAGN
jgi:outer membrane receptor protein involved in Fe transport